MGDINVYLRRSVAAQVKDYLPAGPRMADEQKFEQAKREYIHHLKERLALAESLTYPVFEGELLMLDPKHVTVSKSLAWVVTAHGVGYHVEELQDDEGHTYLQKKVIHERK